MGLKKQVFSGVKWVAFANIFQQIVSLVGLIIFAKLLSPHDFGTFSILMIFIGFLAIFSDLGTSAALIHIKEPSDTLLSTVFYLNVAVGFFLFLLLYYFSSTIGRYFHNTDVAVLLSIVAVNFVVMSLSIVQKTLLQKDMNFKYLSLINSVTIFIGLIAGLMAAYSGMGTMSLVIQLMVNTFLDTVILWYFSAWRPGLIFSMDALKSIWGYTSQLSLFTVINYFSKNADNFLIGKYLSSSALGVYSLAYRMMLYPLQNISITLMRVLFPAFSTLQDNNKKFREVYLRTVFYIALVTFPIMTGLMAVAELLVDVIFGDKWQGLGVLLMVLAPSGLLRSVYATVGSIFMAKGSTDIQLKIGVVNAILTVAGFIIGLQWGVLGVAGAYLCVNLLMLYPIFKISWREIELSFVEGIKVMLPLFLNASVMGGMTYLLGLYLKNMIENDLLRLIVLVGFGTFLYILLTQRRYGSLRALIGALRS